MFSVDNFYYVLYKNLLEPTKFLASYFYPFGKTDANSLRLNWENNNFCHSEYGNIVLFYDQEPLINDQLPVQNILPLHLNSNCKLLANSEKSLIKKQICKRDNYLDWYYFYHGFAALSWFNDFKYMPNVEHQFTKLFISLNRLHTNHRSYRLNLISEFVQRDLLKSGYVSFPSHNQEHGSWQHELDNEFTLLPKQKLNQIRQNLSSLSGPLIVDKQDLQGFLSADCGTSALMMGQSAFWHVVGETIFYLDKLHLTEKIFKPITVKRPFILVGAPGNLEYLKSYGFQTFSNWIDESYDSEIDHDKRIMKVVDQIEKMSKLSQSQLLDMHRDMKSVLQYNYEHFYNDFKNIIIDELLNNFQTCIQIYNNGRTDDRYINLSNTDFQQLRTIFLR